MALRITAVLAMVALVLGCGENGPVAPHEWQGIGQTSSRTYVVRLVYTRYGSNVLGSYYLDGRTTPTGKAAGRIDGELIFLDLSPSTTCNYSFAGTITETRLTGTFVPDPCPAGIPGTWDLLRSN